MLTNHKKEKAYLKYLLKKNACISRSVQFKSVLFKGKLYYYKTNIKILMNNDQIYLKIGKINKIT